MVMGLPRLSTPTRSTRVSSVWGALARIAPMLLRGVGSAEAGAAESGVANVAGRVLSSTQFPDNQQHTKPTSEQPNGQSAYSQYM
jgi:hypothetical protein